MKSPWLGTAWKEGRNVAVGQGETPAFTSSRQPARVPRERLPSRGFFPFSFYRSSPRENVYPPMTTLNYTDKKICLSSDGQTGSSNQSGWSNARCNTNHDKRLIAERHFSLTKCSAPNRVCAICVCTNALMAQRIKIILYFNFWSNNSLLALFFISMKSTFVDISLRVK